MKDKHIKTDKRMLEQNQNVTKQYAVSYAILATHSLINSKKKITCEKIGTEMIAMMRAVKPKEAVKKADQILSSN